MRENEATPSGATAIPVNSNTLVPGCVPITSGGTGGRSGTSAAVPTVPVGGRRRRPRPRPFSRGLYGVLLKLIDATKHLSPRDRIRLLTGVLLVAALIAILMVGEPNEKGFLLFALVAATLVMIVGKEKDGGIRKAALIFTFVLAVPVIQAGAREVSKLLEEDRTVTNPVPGSPQVRLVS